MGSPITFSGFNQIDFNLILNAVMNQERGPLTRLENQKKTLETQNTAFSTLAGKLTSLESAIEKLGTQDSLALVTASSSDAGVGVSATTGTITGTYDVVVSQLARAQVTASATTYNATSAAAVTGGTLTLTLTRTDGEKTATITAATGTTLAELAAQINAAADSPAAASVVQTSPGQYRLVLTGKETGTTNGFTVTRSLDAGTAIDFADADANGTYDNTQNAIDAQFSVNGLGVTSASNTVKDVVPGVTLSLLKEDAAVTATVKVTRDTAGAKDLVKKFISAYNDLTTFAKDQNTAAIAGKASIGRDPLLRGLRDSLRNAMTDEYAGGSVTRLAAIGIGFDMTGKMVLDESIFANALDASASDVQQLLSGADGTGGAFGAMRTLIEDYTETGGLVSSVRERIDETIRGLNRRMDGMQAQLELRRLSLQKEYMAADLAMTRLKAQSASLQAVGQSYRLF